MTADWLLVTVDTFLFVFDKIVGDDDDDDADDECVVEGKVDFFPERIELAPKGSTYLPCFLSACRSASCDDDDDDDHVMASSGGE